MMLRKKSLSQVLSVSMPPMHNVPVSKECPQANAEANEDSKRRNEPATDLIDGIHRAQFVVSRRVGAISIPSCMAYDNDGQETMMALEDCGVVETRSA